MTTNNSGRHALPSSVDTTLVALPNGITVLARANDNSPSVAVSGYLPVGALFDPDEKLGLSDFTSLALMRGTARQDFQEIFDSLESVGASFGYSGGTHTTGFGGKALAEDLDLLLKIFAETIRTPVFPGDQLERLRAQITTHLAIRAQDTSDMASLTFDQLVYEDHPYSRPEEGYPETVANITRADLVEFHRRHYGPEGLVIAIVGAVDPRAAVDLVSRHLGDWRNPGQPKPPDLPPVRALPGIVTRQVWIPGKRQADFLLGCAGPPRHDPDFIAAALGNNILGQFGMYGRIGDVVREQHGLAYYAFSSLSGGIGPGPWYVSAGTDPAHTEKAIQLVREEIRRFTQEPVSEQELEDSQANFIGRLPLSMESNAGVAAALINLVRYDLGMDYYLQYPDLVRAATPENILQVARRFLDPERLAIATAGPNPKRRQVQTNIAQEAR
jgi:zinc protease